jgi:hypothetical protein
VSVVVDTVVNIAGGIGDAISGAFDIFVEAVEGAWNALIEANFDLWGAVWDNILQPILEPIAALLGFTDYTVVAVAVYSTPLYDETLLTSFTDTMAKATINDKDIFDEIRFLILEGRHVELTDYYNYGVDTYANALPTITSTYATFNLTVLARAVYAEEYALTQAGITPVDAGETALALPTTSGYPPIVLLYESLKEPIDDHMYRAVLYENYTYNTIDSTVVIDSKLEYLAAPSFLTYGVAGYVETATVGVTLPREDTDITVNFLPWVTTDTTITVDVYENDVLQTSDATNSVVITSGLASDVDGVVIPTQIVDEVLDPNGTTKTITTTDVIITTARRSTVTHTIAGTNARFYQASYIVDGRDVGKVGYYSTSLYSTTLIEGLGEATTTPVEGDSYLQILPVVSIKSVGSYVDANKASNEYITSKGILDILHVDIDEVISSVKQSPDIDTIHSIGVSLGVSMASENQACKKYLYAFFQLLYSRSFNGTSGTTSELLDDTAVFGMNEGTFNAALTYKDVSFTSKVGTVLEPGEVSVNIISSSVVEFTKGLVGGNQEVMRFNDLVLTSWVKQAGTSEVDMAIFTLSSDPTENDFIVPISLGIFRELSIMDRNAVSSRSAHMYMYAGTYQELEWYQSETFIQLVGFVLMVIAFIYGGPGGSAAVSAWITYLIQFIAISFVAGLIFEKLLEIAKDSDEAWVDALVFIAAAYMMMTMGDMGDTPMLLTDQILLGVTAVANAATLVMTANSLGESEDYQKELTGLENQYDAYEEQYAELFEPKSTLGYDVIMEHVESPETFFARTLGVDTTNLALNLDIMLQTDLDYKLEV